jgi:hypothetical protein
MPRFLRLAAIAKFCAAKLGPAKWPLAAIEATRRRRVDALASGSSPAAGTCT